MVPGFAHDIRSTAFEMFARSQTAAAVPGLGVGLAIARTLVEVLDGSVTIEDAAPGPGAIARISLPRLSEALATSTRMMAHASRRRGST